MEFGMGWGTDEISSNSPYSPSNYDITHENIQKRMKTTPYIPPSFSQPVQPVTNQIESFENEELLMNEQIVICVFLFILILISVVIYQQVKQTKDHITLLITLLAHREPVTVLPTVLPTAPPMTG